MPRTWRLPLALLLLAAVLISHTHALRRPRGDMLNQGLQRRLGRRLHSIDTRSVEIAWSVTRRCARTCREARGWPIWRGEAPPAVFLEEPARIAFSTTRDVRTGAL